MAILDQIIKGAQRRAAIVIQCRSEKLTIAEIAKKNGFEPRVTRGYVQDLLKLGYLGQDGTKRVRMMNAAVYITVTDMNYPLPHEKQSHPTPKKIIQELIVPPGVGRIVRFK